MTDILDQRLRPSLDAIESKVGDETVLLHLKSGTYFGLDAMGTRIWSMLKDGVSSPVICERLIEEFDVTGDVVQQDTRQFLDELKSNGIVEEA
jgi:PqqD family protein of HPr-rel-A system